MAGTRGGRARNGRVRLSSLGHSLAALPQDFTDLLTELCESHVEFLLVGGWAVILYGHVRATDDMDIFVRPSMTNSERVFAALEAFGAPLQAHGVAPGHFAKEGDAYRFGMVPLKVEVLTKISGVSFDQALEGRRTFELDGQQIPYIGKATLGGAAIVQQRQRFSSKS